MTLAPGEHKMVQVPLEPLTLAVFDEGKNAWQQLPGDYTLLVGGSSTDLPLTTKVHLP